MKASKVQIEGNHLVHLRSIDLLPTERSTLISSVVAVREILLSFSYNRDVIDAVQVAGEDCAVKDIRKMHQINVIDLN